MVHSYREFVKEQFKLKPEGVKSSEWMKEIGKRWKIAGIHKNNDSQIKTTTKKKVGGGFIPARDGIYLLLCRQTYLPVDQRASSITASGETFEYDQSLSSLRTAVYHSPTRLIIAHRGTDKNDSTDVSTDILIAQGKFSKSNRAKISFAEAQRAQQKYPRLIMSNTGHSLGGTAAQYVGYHSDFAHSKVVAFNAGCSPLKREYPKCDKNDNSDYCKKQRYQTLYTTANDIISQGQIDVSTIVSQEPDTNAHSLNNYKIMSI
jgi:hypothetical protein